MREEKLGWYRIARKLEFILRVHVLEPRHPFMVVSVLHGGWGSRPGTTAVGGPEMLFVFLARAVTLRRSWTLVSMDTAAIVEQLFISVTSVAMWLSSFGLVCAVSLSST